MHEKIEKERGRKRERERERERIMLCDEILDQIALASRVSREYMRKRIKYAPYIYCHTYISVLLNILNVKYILNIFNSTQYQKYSIMR